MFAVVLCTVVNESCSKKGCAESIENVYVLKVLFGINMNYKANTNLAAVKFNISVFFCLRLPRQQPTSFHW